MKEEPLRVGVLRLWHRIPEYSEPHFMSYMAKNFNIELYFFTAEDINFDNNTVEAVFAEGGTQIKCTVPLPKIIYNLPDVIEGRSGIELKEKLQKAGCYLVRPALRLNKQRIYDGLNKNEHFKEYLIETHTVESFDSFLSFLKKYDNDVVLKPAIGTEGKGVTRITFDATSGEYIASLQKGKLFFKNVSEFKDYYEGQFVRRLHTVQPYIVSRTKHGNPFDIRILVLLAPEEKFKFIPYPRIGGDTQGFISNLGAGGYTKPFDRFLTDEFGDKGRKIRKDMLTLGSNLAKYCQSFFNEKPFAIGIDVAIVRHGEDYSFKIFEINLRNPGRVFFKAQVAFAALEYMQYLGKTIGKSDKS
ncbi:MAG: YheC/YheD family protein [Selenomonadaceae bacterium]|nr:YheC/YheD family protein [Selenomonadaceae bacterium]